MPWTWATFLIASIAITGFGIPLSGFFSKDAILHGVHSSALQGYQWVGPTAWAIGLATAFCTAFYMGRLYLLTFEGKRAPDARAPHAHESAWAMRLPLVVLAALSVLGALYGVPTMRTSEGWQTVMENFLYPVFFTARRLALAHGTVKLAHEGSLIAAWALAWVIALVGGGLAGFLYLRYFPSARAARALRFPLLVRWARNKFYVDELYEWVIVRPIKLISFVLYKVVDTLLIDTLAVRGTAWVTARVGSVLRYTQSGDAQSYAAVMALALLSGAAYALFQVLR
jgi:NADH-quinone oxidoreductase subunit L